MANSIVTAAPACLYVYITTNLQSLYATRGMWLNGQPQGVLAGMLGPLVPCLSTAHRQAFYVSPDQLAALWRDLCSVPPEVIGGQRHAQFLRRLREAANRGGLEMSDLLDAQPGSLPSMASSSAAGRTKTAAPVPFHPLRCPSHGKALTLFRDHVMRTVREFVDYSQGSEYLQGGQAQPRKV